MRKRKVKRSRPMFKKRRSTARTVLNVILVIILLLAIAFLGYSVGKPIVEFFNSGENRKTVVTPSPSESTAPIDSEKDSTLPTEKTDPVTEDVKNEPIPEPKNRILFVSMPESGSFEEYLSAKIAEAKNGEYYGIAVELVADGGKIGFATSNEKAVMYSAASENALGDLGASAKLIKDSGLTAYARISALTDHIVSWDKGICYLFEDSTSTWLDNSVANGGKPWISAFSQSARDYISSIAKEICDAGYDGIIAGDIIFPPFRNSDLRYVGATVQSADRYKALIDFSNAVSSSLGDKSYAIEVDALDIISGKAEVLKDLASLYCETVYVKYDSQKIGERVEKTDGTEISYAGLSESDKLTLVFRTVNGLFEGSGKTVIPAVKSEDEIKTLASLGYDEHLMMVY